VTPHRAARPLAVVALGVAVLALAAPAGAQETKKTVLKITVPSTDYDGSPTKLTIDGKESKQTGEVREFETPALDASKEATYTVELVHKPNNYTTITRTKKVTFKPGGTVDVDMRKAREDEEKILVRWVPTPNDVVEEMCRLGKITKDDVVYDLGCGDGIMVCIAVGKMGGKRGVGIDIDPKRLEEAKETAKEWKVADKTEWKKGDLLELKPKDIDDATLILIYLGNDLNNRIKPCLQGLKPGTRIVSHRFTMGDWAPDKTIEYQGKDGDTYKLHLWVVKDKK
jgi:uncharacterized protein (TIGR03000 family)